MWGAGGLVHPRTSIVLIDRSRVEAESDNEVVGAESSYTFTRRSLGSPDF